MFPRYEIIVIYLDLTSPSPECDIFIDVVLDYCDTLGLLTDEQKVRWIGAF